MSKVMLNRVILSGIVVRDPEFRQFNEGNRIANGTIVYNHYFKSKNSDEFTQKPVFIDLTFAGRAPDKLEKYNVKKGDTIIVEGSLHQDFWEKDGRKNSKIYIMVDRFSLVSKSKKDEQKESEEVVEKPVEEEEDNLPF